MTILSILTLIGSIGLFLYGLKLMSEGLQKIAGDSLRSVLAAMTKNPVTGMLSGMLVTALLQSSSATTVMVVSYVNAGLINLVQSFAVILGANVGTTVTPWIIALIGFKYNIAYFAFPLIALSLPFFNSHKNKKNSWGAFILGFALLFLGLEELKQSISFGDASWLIQSLSFCSSYGIGSIAIFLIIGILLTMIVQASSATFTITALFCFNGWISFEMGCAIIIGANIGTCISPIIASKSANTMAKRAAVANLLFNVVGAIWSLAIFYYFCSLINYMSNAIGFGSDHPLLGVTVSLALFHTLFNFFNLCILSPFTKYCVSIISKIIPETEEKEESFKLTFIDKSFIGSSSELALVQVQKEVSRYGAEVYKMFGLVKLMLDEKNNSDRQLELMQKVGRMEEESDRAELEIAQYLNQISPKTLSYSGEQLCRNLYKMVDELESVADGFFHCSTMLSQKSDQRVHFTALMIENIQKMISLLDASLLHMLKVLESNQVPNNALDKAYNYEDEINNFRNLLRNQMLESVENKQIDYQQNTYFMLIINECERIGDYIINVIAAASE